MRTAGETVTLGKSHIGQLRTAVGTGGQSTENLDGQERTSANTPTVSYARGQDLSGTLEGAGGIGGLLARSDQYSGGTWGRHVFYHADGNGNVTALIDNAQTVVAAYRYNPYGQLLGSSGTLAGVNTLRFSSKQIHPSVGLYYYGYRFYEPNLQRWINRDPIGELGGINFYAFVFGNPIVFVDPSGLTGKEAPRRDKDGLPPERPLKPRPDRSACDYDKKAPGQKYEEISERQRTDLVGIQSTDKSRQDDQQELKELADIVIEQQALERARRLVKEEEAKRDRNRVNAKPLRFYLPPPRRIRL